MDIWDLPLARQARRFFQREPQAVCLVDGFEIAFRKEALSAAASTTQRIAQLDACSKEVPDYISCDVYVVSYRPNGQNPKYPRADCPKQVQFVIGTGVELQYDEGEQSVTLPRGSVIHSFIVAEAVGSDNQASVILRAKYKNPDGHEFLSPGPSDGFPAKLPPISEREPDAHGFLARGGMLP